MILLFCNIFVTFSCNLVLPLWFESALALCRAERTRSSANSFIVSAVRVFNTFNTFNRFSTKCCTMIFVILTNFQHFNKFSTKLSTLFFAFYLRFSVKFQYFSTFPLSLLLLLQQVIYYTALVSLRTIAPKRPRARACALRARARAR